MLPLIFIVQDIVNVIKVAGKLLPLRLSQLLQKLCEQNPLFRHLDVLLIGGIIRVFLKPADLFRTKTANHRIRQFIIVSPCRGRSLLPIHILFS